jgi:hypothetical protein
MTAHLHFEIYPNPTSSVLNVMVKGKVRQSDFHLQILDFSGHICLQDHITNGNKTIIDVSRLPAGIYLCLIVDNNHPEIRGTKKLVIVR